MLCLDFGIAPFSRLACLQDDTYLSKLKTALLEAFEEFTPDIIFYNAGTDILDGDPLGQLAVSPAGVKKRDFMVFDAATTRRIPLVMLLSGTVCVARFRLTLTDPNRFCRRLPKVQRTFDC